MSKDPAFLMYSKDWITGTQFMSMEERGIYITLIMAQHQNGHLDTKRVGFILGLNWDMVPAIVKAKFETDADGFVFNERLDLEMEKRASFVSKQKENGSKGGRPKKPKQNPDINPNPNPNKTMHVVNVNGNGNLDSDEKGGMGEKTKEVFEALKTKYNLSELNNFNKIRELGTFCTVIQNTGFLDHFIKQHEFYTKYKTAAEEKTHGLMGFLGTIEKQYQDGGWNAENWEQKYLDFKPHGKQQNTKNDLSAFEASLIADLQNP